MLIRIQTVAGREEIWTTNRVRIFQTFY